ncbi:ATP-binding cassette domain-containing protein [Periweissella beninensis]|uniref:ATP-binding cassette domain-containing protein n=1 Tax=Periweissella beninensis TaxID=504936 RepID=UPI0021A3890B|nr:ATP-binding cassette domain-containing protein [Periweissella beninensis]MCT4396756.1 ATP-binding cassette domain-containing protein [Periweissella beninensis]
MLEVAFKSEKHANIDLVFKRLHIYMLRPTLAHKRNILNTISGFMESSNTMLSFDGQQINNDIDLVQYRRENVRVILKNDQLIEYLTPVEYVKIALDLDQQQRRVDYPYMRDALKKMGINQELAHERISKLNEKKRYAVALAGALTVKAPVVIIDDITQKLSLSELNDLLQTLRWLMSELDKIIILNSNDNQILNIDHEIISLA